jgi:DNA replication protein DnaC
MNQPEEAHLPRGLNRYLGQRDWADPVICDGLGYVSFSRLGAELLFEEFAARSERRSLLVRSNLPFGEWARCSRARG